MKKPGQNIRRKKARILAAVHTCSWKHSLDFFLPIHSSQRCCIAVSSCDEIACLLNLGAADSHTLMNVISENFAESDVDLETDEEDASAEGKQ